MGLEVPRIRRWDWIAIEDETAMKNRGWAGYPEPNTVAHNCQDHQENVPSSALDYASMST